MENTFPAGSTFATASGISGILLAFAGARLRSFAPSPASPSDTIDCCTSSPVDWCLPCASAVGFVSEPCGAVVEAAFPAIEVALDFGTFVGGWGSSPTICTVAEEAPVAGSDSAFLLTPV